MAVVLAVDASTEGCSAALLINDTVKIHKEEAPQGHTKLLLPMIDALLKENNISLKDIDAVATGRGPGSFTGVRIGVSVAEALAYGLQKPSIGVSDLEALALEAMQETGLNYAVAAIDARMGEVYLCIFKKTEDNFPKKITEELVLKPDCAAEIIKKTLADQKATAAGTGFNTYPNLLNDNLHKSSVILPWADAIAKLAAVKLNNGEICKPEDLLPVYIRDQVIWKKVSEQKH